MSLIVIFHVVGMFAGAILIGIGIDLAMGPRKAAQHRDVSMPSAPVAA